MNKLHVQPFEILESHELIKIVRQKLETDTKMTSKLKAVNNMDHIIAAILVLQSTYSDAVLSTSDTETRKPCRFKPG